MTAYNEDKDGKVIERPDLAFSPDGIDELNKNIVRLNNGKHHQPIFKVRIYEPKGSKFTVGVLGNKKDKYVEAAKGTNLFFAVYQDENKKRSYNCVPLNVVIERLKQGLSPVPDKSESGHHLLFDLSPNGLVYVPALSEIENPQDVNWNNLNKEQIQRIYKTVSFSGPQCFFVRNDIAAPIINKYEFSPLNKTEKSMEGIMIKECCWKLEVDRLGKIKRVYK